MLKTPSLPKLLLCFAFWLSTGLSLRVFGQDRGEGYYEDFDRNDSFGERFGGFRGRGGFRGGGFEGGDWGGPGRFGRGGGEDGGARWEGRGGLNSYGDKGEMSSGDRSSGSPSQPAPRQRLTVDLPQTFLEGDLDRDGQIGLYEWRQWRRGDLSGFLALDHNGDGFLTPTELVKGPRPSLPVPGASQGLVSGVDTPSGIGGVSVSGSSTIASGTPTSTGASAGTSPEENRANSMFRLLDTNRNGQLDPDEWGKAKTIRSQFETAKIDLSVVMPKDDFVRNFVSLNKKP